jgi:hypothetical protein
LEPSLFPRPFSALHSVSITQFRGDFTTDLPERQSRNQIELAARERKDSNEKTP